MCLELDDIVFAGIGFMTNAWLEYVDQLSRIDITQNVDRYDSVVFERWWIGLGALVATSLGCWNRINQLSL